MIEQTSSIAAIHSPHRRPGPFGPAWALLPIEQQLLVLESSTPVSDAIERLVDNGFSQIPVADKTGRIVGVFSWRSLGKRVGDLLATDIKPTELSICDAMEPARFISPNVYIDTETDWGDIDYVLVGNADNPKGILCISDVFGRLNDFAEAFVLIYEIEQELRGLISDVCDDSSIARMISELELSPHSPWPVSVEDLELSHWGLMICSETNWDVFEPVLHANRELLQTGFRRIDELRDIVFHFRRGIERAQDPGGEVGPI